MPFLRLLSGPSFFVDFLVVCGGADVVRGSWSPSVSGEALSCLHRPGGWVFVEGWSFV